jgi:hypothetical protein
MYPNTRFPKVLLLLLFILVGLAPFTNAQTTTTLAGGIGDDTTAAIYGRIYHPLYLAIDGSDNIYITESIISSNNIRKLNTSTGNISSDLSGGGRGVFDPAGNWYFRSSNNKVQKKSPGGIVSAFAGNNSWGTDGDGGPATSASFQVEDVAIDGTGNVYICDGNNHRIRKVDTTGIISTVAGSGISGFSGDGGPAVFARLNSPRSIAADAAGNVYIADYTNGRVRMVDNLGIIKTIAGGGSATGNGIPATSASIGLPTIVRLDGAGNVLIYANKRVFKVDGAGIITHIAGNDTLGFSGEGGPATAAKFNNISDIAIGTSGDIYIADYNNNRVRKVDAFGIVNTVVGNNLAAIGYGGDGGNPLLALFGNITGFAPDKFGNLFIADYGNNRVRKLSASGVLSTYAGNGLAAYYGDGDTATSAAIYQPSAVAPDRFGNIYIAEYGSGHVRKVNPSGIITTLAGGGGTLGDGGPATAALVSARGVAVDTSGNVYISDWYNNRIRLVDVTTGTISTVAGGGSGGDGGAATNALLNNPQYIALDKSGNLYIGGSPIRKVNSSGIISSLPLNGYSVAVDTGGNVYASNGIGSVLRYDVHGSISTVGNTANAIAIDSLGNLFASVRGNGISKTCCVGTPATLAPTFTKGLGASLNLCNTAAGTQSLDSLLSVLDVDHGETLTWTLTSAPNYGTVNGFPYSATATGGVVVPTGLSYTPEAGHTSGQYFMVRVSDGIFSANIQVAVSFSGAVSVAVSGPTSVCTGNTISLYTSRSGCDWSASNGNASVDTNGKVTGIAAGNTIITCSKNTICGIAMATYTITVNPLPETPVILPGSYSVCQDATLSLSASPAGGTWSSVGTEVFINTSTGLVTGRYAGTGKVRYVISGTCGTAADTADIQVLPKPYAGLLSGKATGCLGDTSIHLSITNATGGVWSSSNTSVATIDAAGNLQYVGAGTASVSYTVTNSCGSSVASTTIQIYAIPELIPISGKSILITGATSQLRGRAPSGIWSSSDTSVAIIDAWGVVTGKAAGDAVITYSETNGNGCRADTTLLIKVTPATEIEFLLFPNPASRLLTIAYKKSAVLDGDIRIIDAVGKAVYTSKINMPSSAGMQQLNIAGIPDGVYTISIKTGDGDFTGKLVIIE